MALRCDVLWSGLGGSPYFSSFFSMGDSAGTGPQDFQDAVSNALNGAEPLISSALTWTVQTPVMIFNPADGKPTGAEPVTPGFGVGQDSGQVLPRAAQGLIRMETGIFANGRQVRGRLFVPGPTEANNDADGTPSSGYISGLTAQFQVHLIDNYDGWAVWSRSEGDMFAINAVSTSAEWAVLTSRRD